MTPRSAGSNLLYYRALPAPEVDFSGTSCAKLDDNLGKVINCMVGCMQMLFLSLLLYLIDDYCLCTSVS